MDSIYGNSIKPKTQIAIVLDGKWVGGYRGGLILEVRMLVNASSMLRMPDQGGYCFYIFFALGPVVPKHPICVLWVFLGHGWSWMIR